MEDTLKEYLKIDIHRKNHQKHKSPAFLLSFSVRRRATLPGPGWVQVPSLLKSLTAVFEMGTGVASSLGPPVLVFEDIEKQDR